MNKRIELPKNVKRIEGLSHRTVSGEFLNPDVCRGRKDGKRAPDAWSAALQAIDAEETRIKDDARSAIRQTQGETQANLEHIENLLLQDREAQETLEREGRMLPETVAAAQYRAAMRDLVIAGLLTILDIAGVLYIAKKVFGGNVLLVSPIGILMTAGVVFGVKTLLEHMQPDRKVLVGKIIMYVGVALIVVGLFGLALLRTVTFDADLAGNGIINTDRMSLGNLLLMLGLGVGLPLILGVFYETESAKVKAARIALVLYDEERRLQNAKNAWTSLSKKLHEIDDRIDDITANIIKLRQNRYVRGYIKGVRKNPEAKQYIDSILKRGQAGPSHRAMTFETVETRRN